VRSVIDPILEFYETEISIGDTAILKN